MPDPDVTLADLEALAVRLTAIEGAARIIREQVATMTEAETATMLADLCGVAVAAEQAWRGASLRATIARVAADPDSNVVILGGALDGPF
jgi:hypothetical protein